jgi:threonine synthase
LETLVNRGDNNTSDRVVVISTAHGLKFVDFKVKYHKMQLEGIEAAQANPPIELPASYAVVRDEMLRQIDERFVRSGR